MEHRVKHDKGKYVNTTSSSNQRIICASTRPYIFRVRVPGIGFMRSKVTGPQSALSVYHDEYSACSSKPRLARDGYVRTKTPRTKQRTPCVVQKFRAICTVHYADRKCAEAPVLTLNTVKRARPLCNATTDAMLKGVYTLILRPLCSLKIIQNHKTA